MKENFLNIYVYVPYENSKDTAKPKYKKFLANSIDLNKVSDSEIMAANAREPLLGLFQAMMRDDLQQNIDHLIRLTRKGWQKALTENHPMLESGIELLLSVNRTETPDTIAEKFGEINPKLEEYVIRVARERVLNNL